MSTEHLRESAIFTQRYVVTPGEEQAVIIGIRDYNRLIERLNGCKPGGWADLWLAGASAGVAVLISALVGALTVPTALSGTRDALWAITGGGLIMVLLCLVAFFTQRSSHDREIAELRKIWKTINPSPPPRRGHWPAIAYHKDPKQAGLREPAGYLCPFSLRNCRAASATSRQPLSKTREWPRPGICWRRVTALLRCCLR